MIANLLTVLIGLWLAYRAIFSVPAGDLSHIEMMAAGVAVILLALWARRTDVMGWNSGTNILLGTLILVLAALDNRTGAARIFLDDAAQRNHRGHCRDVGDALSARCDQSRLEPDSVVLSLSGGRGLKRGPRSVHG
jgi:hypothetical protein